MIVVEGLDKSFRARPKEGKGKLGGLGALAGLAGKGRGETVQVLKQVGFTARTGQIYGLLGPNGAGKTTTLRCIATLLKGDAGRITVDGLDVVEKSREVRAKIGFLTSDMKLAGNLTPRELLEFFGSLNHMDEATIALRIGKLATYLDMKECMDTPVEKCSTGQKQKASIAVSLIHDPDVIIFDEPTNGLDILAAKTVVDFLRDYRSKGKTVVLSTHIMSEAETLCDRIGIMLEGRIVAEGSVDELKEQWGQPDLGSVFFHIAREKGVIKTGGAE